MIEFAVIVRSFGLGKPKWVLAVDPVGERLLIVHDDQSMYWYPLSVCTFVKAQTPDNPRLVLAVQPQQQPQPVELSRAERRRLGRNGPLIL